MFRIWSPIHTAVLHLFLYIRSSNTEKGVERTMKRPLYRLGVMLLALVLVLALPVTSFAATANEWDTSKSKTATNLNSSYISDITLSLPSAQETLKTDVVFVLDESSCSDPVKVAVSSMLDTLYNRIKDTGATVKIGAVQFRGEVTQLALTELSEDTKESITAFMGQRPEVGGSNMSAGLIAGKAMLDADTEVSADRKYLILVSDGITYIWDDETTAAQENYGVNYSNSDTPDKPMLAGPDSWDVKHGKKSVPDWSSWLTDTAALVDKTITEKASIYVRNTDISDKPFVKATEMASYASSVDIALYKSYKVFQSIKATYSHTYVVMAGVEDEIAVFPFGPSFMSFLAGGRTVDFDEIEKEIYYLLDKGSSVVDYMGYTEEYNFNFVDEASKITLKVGGTEYIVNQQPVPLPEGETSHYYFINPNTQTDGDGINPDFELIYVKGNGAEEEHFTWNIKVPVSNFAPVQLTYSVELIDPKKAPGTYGQYDADGSKGYTALYTNNRATLYPIDSNGNQGTSEAFNKPTVSYTIAGQETETPTPSFPTYYPDYSEQPVATPTPTPFVPSDETSPKTGAGDAALPALMIVALAAAGVAVVSMRKRAR